jgi:hypothetical protein
VFGIDIQEERAEAFKEGRESVLGRTLTANPSTLYALGAIFRMGKLRFMLLAPVGKVDEITQHSLVTDEDGRCVVSRRRPNVPGIGDASWKAYPFPAGTSLPESDTRYVRVMPPKNARGKITLVPYEFVISRGEKKWCGR